MRPAANRERFADISMRRFRRILVSLMARATTIGLSCGPHLTRYTMYYKLAGALSAQMPEHPRVLSISGSEILASLVLGRPADAEEAAYPEHDLLDLNRYANESFDLVVSDQVLEHVEGNPQQAVDESLRVLRPGGYVVHTTCFINPVHSDPGDFWRYTPDALRWLHRECDVIAAEGWGNRWAATLMDYGLRRVPVPHVPWHPLNRLATYNDPEWPIVTWVVAHRPP